jgi:hypothetical protein
MMEIKIGMALPAPGPTRPPIQWITGALSLGVKRQERETDHSPPSSAEVRIRGATLPLPHYVFMAWCFVKHCIFLHGVVLI